MGKTAFTINLLENVAVRDRKVVGVFSLQLSRESLLLRMLCSLTGVRLNKLNTGFVTREDYDKLVTSMGALVDAPIFIDDTRGISIPEMRAKCRALRDSQGQLDLIVVDYFQLISPAVPEGIYRFGSQTEELSAVSRDLKALAREFKCPLLAVCSLSSALARRPRNSHPRLSDLRSCGSLEEEADIIAFIFREEFYKPDDFDLEGKAELIIAKQRNGPIGTVRLCFLKQNARFENLANEAAPPDAY
jgi:replicative DNA helicase